MIMISIPMNVTMDQEFQWMKRYNEVKTRLEAQGYVVSPLGRREIFCNSPTIKPEFEVQHWPLVMMGNAFYRMALCDTVYFCKGWQYARGCRLEHQAALDYGLKILYEENEDGKRI